MHVPSERGEFHNEDHLGTCDFYGLVTEIKENTDDMANRILVRRIVEFPKEMWAYLINRCPITNLQFNRV